MVRVNIHNLKVTKSELDAECKNIEGILCELNELNEKLKYAVNIDDKVFDISGEIETLKSRENMLKEYSDSLEMIIYLYETTEQEIIEKSGEQRRFAERIRLDTLNNNYLTDILSQVTIDYR